MAVSYPVTFRSPVPLYYTAATRCINLCIYLPYCINISFIFHQLF
uniref:Uncharacterized protein n=1 Tax=Anguilla anguilla TaxID=7936 RepID=A0A0E9ST41_ANGAN